MGTPNDYAVWEELGVGVGVSGEVVGTRSEVGCACEIVPACAGRKVGRKEAILETCEAVGHKLPTLRCAGPET